MMAILSPCYPSSSTNTVSVSNRLPLVAPTTEYFDHATTPPTPSSVQATERAPSLAERKFVDFSPLFDGRKRPSALQTTIQRNEFSVGRPLSQSRMVNLLTLRELPYDEVIRPHEVEAESPSPESEEKLLHELGLRVLPDEPRDTFAATMAPKVRRLGQVIPKTPVPSPQGPRANRHQPQAPIPLTGTPLPKTEPLTASELKFLEDEPTHKRMIADQLRLVPSLRRLSLLPLGNKGWSAAKMTKDLTTGTPLGQRTRALDDGTTAKQQHMEDLLEQGVSKEVAYHVAFRMAK